MSDAERIAAETAEANMWRLRAKDLEAEVAQQRTEMELLVDRTSELVALRDKQNARLHDALKHQEDEVARLQAENERRGAALTAIWAYCRQMGKQTHNADLAAIADTIRQNAKELCA